MAIDRDKFSNDFQPLENEVPAGYSRAETRYRLNHFLFHALGYDGDSPKEQFRFYEWNELGEMKDPFADGTTYDSDEFLDKIAKGRIVAFPVGEKHPVQLSIEGLSEVVFSRPLENFPIPKPQPPTLSGWKRFANAITFGAAYRKDKAEYERKLAAYPKNVETWERSRDSFPKLAEKRTPNVLEQEKQQYEAEINRREQKALQEKLDAKRAEAKKQYEDLQNGKLRAKVDVYRNTLKEYYGPKAVFHKEFCGPESDKAYTQEQFDQLKDYTTSIDGTEITGEQFTALSMFKALDPEIGGKYDPKGTIGLTPEEVVASKISFLTDTVNGDTDRPRKSHGFVFGRVVEPARRETAAAILEYKQKKPQKLGALIGRGMHMLANHYAGKEIGNEHFLSITSMMADALTLLEKDSNLMEEAKKTMEALAKAENPEASPEKLGATVKRALDLARGQRFALDLNRKNEKAKIILHAEAMGVCNLDPAERQKYIDDRLAFEVVREDTQNDVNAQYKTKEFIAKQKEVTERYSNAPPLPSKGANEKQIRENNRIAAEFTRFEDDTIRAPEAVILMGSGELTPTMMVNNRLPGKNKLYSLSGEQLENALEEKTLLSEKSPYVQEQAENKTLTREKVINQTHKEKDASQKGKVIGS